MTDLEQAEVLQNKAIRGYIIRCLVKGFNNTALTRQISNSMMAAGLVISPDISKHLNYLDSAGYIEYTQEKVTAYTAYAKDAVVRLTKKGVDLAEGTIEDPGVDI
jgi:SOS-response transcriptional repressor LexA